MKEFKTFIPFPPYNYRVYVIFTDSLEESADKLVKQNMLRANHEVDDTTDGFTVRMPNQSYCFVVLKYTASTNHIAHEAYHVVCNMFNWIGAKHEEELFAYHIGYLVQEIHSDREKCLKKLVKGVDKKKKV